MAMLNNKTTGIARGEFAMNKLLRAKINAALNESTVVINKIVLKYDTDYKDYVVTKDTKGLVGYSPVMEAFGLDRDHKELNVTVDVTDDNNNTTTRKVDIDGCRYIYCDSIISIECKDLKKIADLDKNGFEYNGSLYRVLGASPSQQKHGVKFYFRVTEEIPTEKAAYFLMDKVSGYVFTRGIFRNKVDGTKVISANTRWGNYMTGMKSLAQIDLTKDYIVIIDGSIPGAYDFDEETREKMDKVGLSFDNNINDGAVHLGVPVVQEIGQNVGVSLSIENALMVALQVRISYITAKVMSDTMTDEQLKVLASLPGATKYGNTSGRLMLVCDTDGAKALNLTDLEDGVGVLDVFVMAQAAASEPKSSGQHLVKYLNVAPERTLEFINVVTKENLEAYMLGQVEEGKGLTVRDEITRALGNEAFANKLLVEGMIKDSFKFIQSAIAKCKLSINAVYSHMQFDSTFALTAGILRALGVAEEDLLRGILDITKDGFVQAFSPDVLRKFAKEIAAIENDPTLTEEEKEAKLFALLSGTVIKYPSAGYKEFEVVVYQTMKQIEKSIKNKVAALGLNNDDADKMVEALMFYFEHRPFGTTTYAPLNAMKNKLAGADCDFDATMVDMSDLKFILIEQRLEEQKTNPGFMGNCTYISYKDVPRNEVKEVVVEDVLGNTDDIEW